VTPVGRDARDTIDALVVELGEQLDQHPTLADLSRRSGCSPFHFHRRFAAVVGETPKQHVLRVRLERAAYLVAVTEQSILRIALEVGFRAHATFSRAFRQRFRMSPVAYRAAARRAQRERVGREAPLGGDGWQLSAVQAVFLPPARLLAGRHVGPYADVRMAPFQEADQIWNPLVKWLGAEGIAHDRTAWVFCLDDPTVTDGPRQRLDACIPLLGPAKRPGRFAIKEFPGGWYAGVEHVGDYGTIIHAYRHAADWVRRSPAHTLGVGPPVQIFRYVDADPTRHRTEVFLPLARR
jgi:AraC family transcriptional regulator